ncbi:MAG: branched-chain amino acid transaminase [Actinobacteria bacterium]|nr:branched-chain amino acid transaminase [Actinomycetota bacterium]
MAAVTPVKFIWKNGELIEWEKATTHVLTHSLHYGSAVFEGIRCYETEGGKSAVFRLEDHMARFLESGKILMMDIPFTVEELCEATLGLIRANELSSCYIRPIAYRGYGFMGVDPTDAPVDVAIACWYWPAYLGPDALANGVDVCISSWRQRSANALPPAAKVAGSYVNSALAHMEAKQNGFTEAILLNEDGKVCEGSGENIFIVRDGILSTPPLSDGLLEGITRDSVMQIAVDLDIPVIEESLVRTDLYLADEVFMTGSAAELTPIGSVDRRVVGKPGGITKELQERFFAIVGGKVPEYEDWLSYL